MSAGNEIGISPALLQAITHTISSKQTTHSPDVTTISDEATTEPHNARPSIIVNRTPQKQRIIKIEGEGHSLEQIQEAISAISQQTFSGNTIFVVQNVTEAGKTSETPPNFSVKVENGVHVGEDLSQDLEQDSGLQNENTTSVVSLIASQVAEQDGGRPVKHDLDSVPATDFTYPRDLSISDVENVVTETVVQTSYRPEPLENVENTEMFSSTEQKKIRVIEVPEMGMENNENSTTYILSSGQEDSGATTISTDQGAIVYRAVTSAVASISGQTVTMAQNTDVQPEYTGGGCPVCGDKVSGYHYGIYSCESCKGFFKRTVQNKKAFICHRMGECMVSIANRKKCPACRFKRCLVAGMKLEAIREDRTRGGRSSYDGCSPHRPVKLPREPRRVLPPISSQVRPGVLLNPFIIQTSTGSIAIPSTTSSKPTYSTAQSGSSTPTAIVPRSVDLTQVQPQTPQLLDDLMAVESLMTEEEEEQTCCEGKMVEGDTSLFSSLLHFADHCLYRIVRWARNLPDFASVSTDDQIILLQNCWAELLVLCCCWKSIRSGPGCLRLCHGRVLTLDHARAIGLEDAAQRMLGFTEALRDMECDNYEFVAMKGLLLLSPDVKNLKDESVIRRYQDRLIESLMIYTTTNSPSKADKFCQLLARLPELTRLCVLGKELLTQRQQAGEVPQYSLLSELLKGDVAIA